MLREQLKLAEERFKKAEDDRIAASERADVERGIYIWKTEVERARHLKRHTKERTQNAELSQNERQKLVQQLEEQVQEAEDERQATEK